MKKVRKRRKRDELWVFMLTALKVKITLDLEMDLIENTDLHRF